MRQPDFTTGGQNKTNSGEMKGGGVAVGENQVRTSANSWCKMGISYGSAMNEWEGWGRGGGAGLKHLLAQSSQTLP